MSRPERRKGREMCHHCENKADDLGEFFASLDTPSTAAQSVAPRPKAAKPSLANDPEHRCFECNGTGIWQGVRVHQPRRECFACKGKGYFVQSRKKRDAAKARARQKKIDAKAAAVAEFDAANPGMRASLQAISGWNSFAASMLGSLDKWGALTDNQIAAVNRMLAKLAATQEAREKAKAANAIALPNIVKAFEHAKGAGLKQPIIRTREIVLKLATRGNNIGAVFVIRRENDTYCGKVVDGVLKPSAHCTTEICELLKKIDADPIEAARDYARVTGNCSCCGRTLTDAGSVAAGIGPVCAAKFGWQVKP